MKRIVGYEFKALFIHTLSLTLSFILVWLIAKLTSYKLLLDKELTEFVVIFLVIVKFFYFSYFETKLSNPISKILVCIGYILVVWAAAALLHYFFALKVLFSRYLTLSAILLDTVFTYLYISKLYATDKTFVVLKEEELKDTAKFVDRVYSLAEGGVSQVLIPALAVGGLEKILPSKLPIRYMEKNYFLLKIGLSHSEEMLKSLFDKFMALIVLILSLPITLIAALLVWLEGGSVFFTQERVGRFRRKFNVIKFRTMRPDAEKYTGPKFAEKDDPRVTWIGRYLRRYHVDELPQLINILRGEMSFVGPRPERPVFVERFEGELVHYKLRHVVKPGLTGLAQLMAGYDATPEEKLLYDLAYVQNYSLLLDFVVTIKTFWWILKGKEKSW